MEESKLAQKLESASKFTEEELKQIKELQDSYTEAQFQFGQLRVQRLVLDQTELTLIEEYKKLQKKETQIVDELHKKYGEGTLDIHTGVFQKIEKK